VLHVGIILLGIITVKAVEKVVQIVKQEQIIIPESTMSEGDDIGGIPHPGLGGDPTRDARQDIDDSVKDSTGIAEQKGVTNLEAAGSGGDTVGESLIGVGSNTAYGGKGTGTGTGTGTGVTGDLAPFGIPGGGGGIGPKSNFMGSGGNATKVAFVCDASGSMVGPQFDMLKDEISKAVSRLRPVQAFDVVFFKNAGCEALTLNAHSGNLMMATTDNQKKTADFLKEIETGPDSDPVPALRHAFNMKPQLVYLLTDGAFQDNKEVLEEVRRLNASKKVKINTIAFFRMNVEPSDRKLCEEVLGTIASENGGTFKVVMTQDLEKQ
jgi:hypothetical protein